jgi:phage terminase large subunit
MYGGRGSGKSWTVARLLLAIGATKKIRVLCTRELQKSIKQSVHKLLCDQIINLGLDGFYDIQQQGIFGKNGTEFMFFGIKHNPEDIKSTEGIDICWIEEGEKTTESSWDFIDPTIRAKGSEIWVTYNTRFKFDHIHKMFVVDDPPEDSWVQMVNHIDNPYFPDVLRRQMEAMREKDYEKALHIWDGQVKQLATGAIFGKQITEVKKEGRLTFIPIQKNCEVHTFNDIGKNDPCAWWFMQQVGKEYRFIDYYQNRLEDVDHYTRVIKALGYNYGKHWMPHDTNHDRLGMKRNIKEQFEDGGIKPIEIVDRVSDKNVGIQQGRDSFGSCWFHLGVDKQPIESSDGYLPWLEEGMQTRALRMEKGFEALCNYRYKYNDEDDVYQNKPHHGWESNGSDAFLQFAQGYEEDTDDWGDADLDTGNDWII